MNDRIVFTRGVGNDGGVTADCKSVTLETQSVRIAHAPQRLCRKKVAPMGQNTFATFFSTKR